MTDPQESVIRTVIGLVLEREGGVADVHDGAGVTRWGQTGDWLEQWRLPIPHSIDEATMNYRSYLERTDLDALCTVDDSLPDAVIDFAVHSGERVAIAALQRALGVAHDGVLGPVTMTAVATCDREAMAAHVLADRIDSLVGLVADHPSKYLAYLRGWIARVTSQVRTLS